MTAILSISTNNIDVRSWAVMKIDNGNQLTYQASLSATNIDSKRYLRFGAINRTATSDYTVYGLGANVDYTLPSFNHLYGNIDTRLKGGYNMSIQESFTEKGADSLNLNVSNQTYHIGNIGLSETLSWDIENRLGNYSPFISVDFNLQKYLNKPTANQKFVGQNNFKTTIGK